MHHQLAKRRVVVAVRSIASQTQSAAPNRFSSSTCHRTMSQGTPLLPPENVRPTPIRGPFKTAKSLIEFFSTNERKRDPPGPNKTKHIRLITVGISHYCEKVRWALDLLESDPSNPYYYTEDAHPPALQAIATNEASNGQASMTPMVVYTDDETSAGNHKKVLCDSQGILLELCPFLYPPSIKKEVVELESYLGLHLGATIRCFLYFYLLEKQNHNILIKMANSNTSTIESILFEKMLGNGIADGMKKAMKINKESAQQSLESIRKTFSQLSNKLAIPGNGDVRKRDYLMDTDDKSHGLTSADLTLCALAAPLLAPPETEAISIHYDKLIPNEILDLKKELLKTLAGQHVLGIYRQHRLKQISTNQNSKKPYLKVVNRNRLPVGVHMSVAAGTAICCLSILSKI